MLDSGVHRVHPIFLQPPTLASGISLETCPPRRKGDKQKTDQDQRFIHHGINLNHHDSFNLTLLRPYFFWWVWWAIGGWRYPWIRMTSAACIFWRSRKSSKTKQGIPCQVGAGKTGVLKREIMVEIQPLNLFGWQNFDPHRERQRCGKNRMPRFLKLKLMVKLSIVFLRQTLEIKVQSCLKAPYQFDTLRQLAGTGGVELGLFR